MAISDRLAKLTTDITNAYTSIENKLPKILPEEYQQVEYIESTGTQYIDTNVTNSATWEMQMKMEWTSFLHGGRGFTYASNGINNNMQIASTKGGSWTATGSSSENPIILNQIYNVSISQSTKKMLVNGIEMASRSYIQVDEQKICLFGCSTYSGPSGYCYEKVYSAKIYDNNTLVRDFVPCYRISDNEIGLYDLVNNVFYTNAGTGTFLKGYDSAIGMAKNTENLSTAIDSIEVIEEATAEGETLTLTNTKAMPVKSIKVKGKTEQDGEPTPDTPVEIKNVEGKNKLNPVSLVIASPFKSMNKENVLTIDINNTGNFKLAFDDLKLPVGDYTIYCEILSGDYTGGNLCFFDLSDTQISVEFSFKNSTLYPNHVYNLTATNGLNQLKFYKPYCTSETKLRIGIFKGTYKQINFLPYNSIEFKVENADGTQEQTALFTFEEGQYLAEGGYLADDGIHNKYKKVIFDGSSDENWTLQNAAAGQFRITISSMTNNPLYCTHFGYKLSYYPTGKPYLRPTNGALYAEIGLEFLPEVSVSAWKSWLSNNPITVEYELAEETITKYNATQQAQWNAFFKTKTYDDITYITTDGNLAPIVKVDYYKKI